MPPAQNNRLGPDGTGIRLSVERLAPENLDRLAVALADLFTILYDERPRSSNVSVSGAKLVWVFDGGLSAYDRTLLGAGRADRIRAFREQFLAAVESRLREVVHAMTGRAVREFVGIVDPSAETTTCVFTLEASTILDDQHEALRNWSAQVRRHAQELRAAHVRTRAVQEQLAHELKLQRERTMSSRRDR